MISPVAGTPPGDDQPPSSAEHTFDCGKSGNANAPKLALRIIDAQTSRVSRRARFSAMKPPKLRVANTHTIPGSTSGAKRARAVLRCSSELLTRETVSAIHRDRCKPGYETPPQIQATAYRLRFADASGRCCARAKRWAQMLRFSRALQPLVPGSERPALVTGPDDHLDPFRVTCRASRFATATTLPSVRFDTTNDCWTRCAIDHQFLPWRPRGSKRTCAIFVDS